MSELAPVSRAEYNALLARVAALEQAQKMGDAAAGPEERELKVWIMEEAERTGLKYHGIWKRIERGHYPHLTVRRVNSRLVFLSGGHRPPVFTKKIGRGFAYDFAGVDWSRSDREVAESLGCERSLVTRRRKERQQVTVTIRASQNERVQL
jgi:hypothetical protein